MASANRSEIDIMGLEDQFISRWQPVSHIIDKDETESERVGQKIRACAKQCWFNARRVVLKLEDYRGASYVEGWCITESGLQMEHGWVIREGKIIDPTLPTRNIHYFPGLEFVGR